MWYFRPGYDEKSYTQHEDKEGHPRAHVCHPRLRLRWQFTRALDSPTLYLPCCVIYFFFYLLLLLPFTGMRGGGYFVWLVWLVWVVFWLVWIVWPAWLVFRTGGVCLWGSVIRDAADVGCGINAWTCSALKPSIWGYVLAVTGFWTRLGVVYVVETLEKKKQIVRNVQRTTSLIPIPNTETCKMFNMCKHNLKIIVKKTI